MRTQNMCTQKIHAKLSMLNEVYTKNNLAYTENSRLKSHTKLCTLEYTKNGHIASK